MISNRIRNELCGGEYKAFPGVEGRGSVVYNISALAILIHVEVHAYKDSDRMKDKNYWNKADLVLEYDFEIKPLYTIDEISDVPVAIKKEDDHDDLPF